MIFYVPYIYGANFIAKFRWESGFLRGGSMEPPLGHQREYLGHLSVKVPFAVKWARWASRSSLESLGKIFGKKGERGKRGREREKEVYREGEKKGKGKREEKRREREKEEEGREKGRREQLKREKVMEVCV